MAGKKRLLTDYKTLELAPRKGKRRLYWCGAARLAWFPHARLKAFTGYSLRKTGGTHGLQRALEMHHESFLTWEEKWALRDKKRSMLKANSL